MPWWGAIVIAATATAIGFALSSSAKELSALFASLYVIGCVAAVLAVQQAGIFTAIIQPPLILFIAVPGSYYVFHGAEFTGLKDTLINYGYPLIERFPLMFFTAAAVLLIGLVRWYFAAGSRASAPADGDADVVMPTKSSPFAGLAASVIARFKRDESTDAAEPEPARPRRRHGADRSTSTQRRSRTQRSSERSAQSRSRHSRPSRDDIRDGVRDEQSRDSQSRRNQSRKNSSRENPSRESQRPRRRSAEPREPREPGRSSRSSRREPSSRDSYDRDSYDRGPSRSSSRFEPYEPQRSESFRDSSFRDSYRPFDEPSSYRPRNDDSSAHHPISRVRYRGADDDFDDRSESGQSRFESRPRRSPERPSREPDWRYDR